MVDVQAANAKLANRKEEMLVYLTGRTREDAQRALASANGSVKLAVLLLHGCGVERAQTLLSEARGNLRIAVDRYAEGSGRHGAGS